MIGKDVHTPPTPGGVKARRMMHATVHRERPGMIVTTCNLNLRISRRKSVPYPARFSKVESSSRLHCEHLPGNMVMVQRQMPVGKYLQHMIVNHSFSLCGVEIEIHMVSEIHHCWSIRFSYELYK